MRKKRLFILIYAMLISLALVGCSNSQNISEIEVSEDESELKTETETETQELETTRIKASMYVQFSDRDISIYSDTSCFFSFDADIVDIDCFSTNHYGPFEISAGEKMNFSIEDLSPDFFSENAKINEIYVPNTFVYGDSPLDERNYDRIDAGIEFKCYKDKIVLRANKDCLVSLYLVAKDENFESGYAYIYGLKINANETTTFTLNDLAPGFYSDKAEIISYSPLTIETYTEEK